jgi:Tfp pilus assembly protein PilF
MWNLSLTIAFAVLAMQNPDPGYEARQKAYDALRIRDYDAAVAHFERAVEIEPKRTDIRKDLAYTLLKIGENEAARDQFGEALRLNPGDHHVALEYAFLCYETKQKVEARRIFDRVRKSGDAQTKATAETAFQNVDRPLAAGIAKWLQALESAPTNFSAHEELARLAEERDDWKLAAEHYEAAWQLRPEIRELLLDLGRVWKLLGRNEEAAAALLAASRGAQPRVAERAKALSPARYPYVYEFRKALELDAKNVELRRELAYLLLEMGNKSEAEAEFQQIVEAAPDDLLSVAQYGFLLLARKDERAQPLLRKVVDQADGELADRVRAALGLPQSLRRRDDSSGTRAATEAKLLAEKSLQAGYMKDALKYLTTAHEDDPVDFDVMLKLGWTNNILKDDRTAIRWFNLARKSPDQKVAAEARRAYTNLRPGLARFRTTAWLFPMYSSRWRDLFSYGQVKTEFRIGQLPLRPYLSVRFIGNAGGRTDSLVAGVGPQYLSESSFIFGAGVATRTWRGITGWAEAGRAMRYLGSRNEPGSTMPDYRGGVSFARGFGKLLGPASKGLFAETNDDAAYISRFNRDLLFYTQNRTGYTFRAAENSGFQAQLYWNWNATVDVKREHWANFVETGPGVRFRWKALPPAMVFSINAVHGKFLIREGNPLGAGFNDIRVGFWYAFTR